MKMCHHDDNNKLILENKNKENLHPALRRACSQDLRNTDVVGPDFLVSKMFYVFGFVILPLFSHSFCKFDFPEPFF